MAERNNALLMDIMKNGMWPVRPCLPAPPAARGRGDRTHLTPTTFVQVLHEYWGACTNLNQITRAGIAELEPLMDLAVAISADIGKHMNMDKFFEHLAELHAQNIPAIFTLSVGADAVGDPRMTSAKLMHARSPYGVGPSAISMPTRDHYLDEAWERERGEFRAHVGRMFRIYLDERGEGLGGLSSEEAASMVVELETRLAEIIPEFYEGRRNEDKGFTLREMREHLQWMTPYFTSLYAAVGLEMPRDNSVIYVDRYLTGLLRLLNDTEPEAMRAYLVYAILRERAPFLKERFLDEHFDFYGTVLRGRERPQKREDFCLDMAGGSDPYGLYTRITSVSELLGRYFMQETFPRSSVAKSW